VLPAELPSYFLPNYGKHVFAGVEGVVTRVHVSSGDRVKQGRDELRAERSALIRLQFDDDTATPQLPQIGEQLASLARQIEEKERDLQQLRLTACRVGDPADRGGAGHRSERHRVHTRRPAAPH